MKVTGLLGIGALAFVLVLGFLPATAGFSSGPTHFTTANGCQITWTVPSGTYAPGSTESALVSTQCAGIGVWALTGPTSSAASFTCAAGGCSSTVLFSKVLVPGSYTFLAVFAGVHFAFSFTVSTFLVASELPVGVLLGVLAPIAAVVGYSKLKPRL